MIPPPANEQNKRTKTPELKVIYKKENEDKKVLKIKKKQEEPKTEETIETELVEEEIINEKEIIPPLIKNRPKKIKKRKIKKEAKTNEVDNIEKIREKQMLDKEKAIDFLYNGERQEDYLIKYSKVKKNSR